VATLGRMNNRTASPLAGPRRRHLTRLLGACLPIAVAAIVAGCGSSSAGSANAGNSAPSGSGASTSSLLVSEMLDSFFPASGAEFVDGQQFDTFENVAESAAEDRCMIARGWKVAMPITTRANLVAESHAFEDNAIWPNLGWIRANGLFVAPSDGGSQVGLSINATSSAERADYGRCITTSEAPMQAFVNTVRPLSGTWINTVLQLQQAPSLAGDKTHLSSCLTQNGASTRGARSLNSFLAYWVQSAISAQPRGADRLDFEHRWAKIFVRCATPLITAEQNLEEKSRKAFTQAHYQQLTAAGNQALRGFAKLERMSGVSSSMVSSKS
jgi:hypothetical protein